MDEKAAGGFLIRPANPAYSHPLPPPAKTAAHPPPHAIPK
jgi:hypothetical protein